MRVLMLSWEYPPLMVGGLGRHVEGLARALAAAGHDLRMVTRGAGAARTAETRDGVRILRAALDPLDIGFTTESLLAWSQAAEHALLRTALPALRRWRPDVLHAHDWLVAQSAVTLAEATGAPIVTTVHATEHGRHGGRLNAPLHRAIDSVERWLVRRSAQLITCSNAMRDEVVQQFGPDPRTVAVLPNAIDPDRWPRRGGVRTGPPVLVYAGRLVHEKGIQTLLDALRPLRTAYPGLRLAVAGTGPYEDDLRAHARRRGVARAVDWLGFVPEAELPAHFAAADVAVVPSWYEPFGIVALEAAAVGTPVVVAATGGLVDLAADGVAVGSFAPRDPAALTAAVAAVLADPAPARQQAARAARRVRRRYGWPAVAAQTVGVYERAAAGLNDR